MRDQPVYRLPTVEEVLSGETQGGVPRPMVSTDDVIDRSGTPIAASPTPSRWAAVKALLRIIFKGA